MADSTADRPDIHWTDPGIQSVNDDGTVSLRPSADSTAERTPPTHDPETHLLRVDGCVDGAAHPSDGCAAPPDPLVDFEATAALGRAIHQVFRHGAHGSGRDHGDGDLAAALLLEVEADGFELRRAGEHTQP